MAWHHGLVAGEVVVMIHSGSRDVGFFVGSRWMDRARHAWPKGVRHPQSGLYGLTGELAADYMEAMGVASRYAWLNRTVLAELVRDSFAQVFAHDESRLVVDVPHNVILREHGMNIHRKGATPARAGDLALIPGSMGDYSYVATGMGQPGLAVVVLARRRPRHPPPGHARGASGYWRQRDGVPVRDLARATPGRRGADGV